MFTKHLKYSTTTHPLKPLSPNTLQKYKCVPKRALGQPSKTQNTSKQCDIPMSCHKGTAGHHCSFGIGCKSQRRGTNHEPCYIFKRNRYNMLAMIGHGFGTILIHGKTKKLKSPIWIHVSPSHKIISMSMQKKILFDKNLCTSCVILQHPLTNLSFFIIC